MHSLYSSCLLWVLILGTPLSLDAQSFFEPTSGPEGGTFWSAASGNGYVLAGAQNGIYRSIDNGRSWSLVPGEPSTRINNLVIHPGGAAFALVANGPNFSRFIYRSLDEGRSWQSLVPPAPLDTFLRVLVGNRNDIVLVARSGVYRSTDYGETWDSTSLLGGNGYAATQHSPTEMYVLEQVGPDRATDMGRVLYRSTDEGVTWERRIDTISPGNGLVGTTSSGALLFGRNDGTSGIMRLDSLDGQLVLSNDGLPSNTRATARVEAAPNGDLYLGNQLGVYLSTDDGRSWQPTDRTRIDRLVNVIHALDDGTILVGTNVGLFRSTDRGASWEPSSRGFIQSPTYGLVVADDGSIIASTLDEALHRSSDGGSRWEEIDIPMPEGSIVWTMANNAQGALFAGSLGPGSTGPGSIYRSTDNGATWQPAGIGVTAHWVRTISVAPTGEILAATDSGLYRSTNAGDSWEQINTGLPTRDISAAVSHDGVLIATTTGTGIWRSSDNGANWQDANVNISDPFSPYGKLVVTSRGAVIAFSGSANRNAYRSTDNALSWEVIPGFATADRFVTSMISDNGGTLYAALHDRFLPEEINDFIYRSTDDGVSWQLFDTLRSVSGLFVRSFALAPSGQIFLTFQGAGVWRSTLPTGILSDESRAGPAIPISQLCGGDEAVVEYDLPLSGLTSIHLYNALGEHVEKLFDGWKPGGTHSVAVDLRSVPSGVYFLRIASGDYTSSLMLARLP